MGSVFLLAVLEIEPHGLVHAGQAFYHGAAFPALLFCFVGGVVVLVLLFEEESFVSEAGM